ncbi:MAG: exodeoxyribonuclease VII large subunit [Legionellales bacterium]|nr:exodeoxyribonuclease VII large subunit [Legionellales bacterium]
MKNQSKKILKVPFPEKDIVKALGGKWDAVSKHWYVPAGMSLVPFAKWLPDYIESGILEREDSENNTLLNLLSKIAQLIFKQSRQSEWITAEISNLSRHRSGHYYLDLVEHNSEGIVIAKISAIIWKDIATSLVEKFSLVTKDTLKSDIKVLILVKIQFDVVYGLKLIIEDIDPAYTIGDMAVKLKKIRGKLLKEDLLDNNKRKIISYEYNNIAVISPHNAAGLGDFKKESELLQKYNLCRFKYYHAAFQGKEATKEIIAQIAMANADHLKEPFDILVIIRGGGSPIDLAWLNDYDLARSVCESTLPIICGIGHRKDHTILNDVSNKVFDTPSKVSTFIYNSIILEAEEFVEQFNNILSILDRIIK